MSNATMTYTSLIADVLTYTERPEDPALALQLPRLLMIAENKLAAKLKTLGVQGVLRTTLVSGTAVLEKPAFWRNTMSFAITDADGASRNLFLRSYEFCKQFWPTRTNLLTPRYYADYNYENFFIAPTPDYAYAVELIYHPRLVPLSADVEVNWFTTNAPQVLLTAVMVETFLWLKNTEKAAAWSAMRDEAIADLTREDDARGTDRTTVIR